MHGRIGDRIPPNEFVLFIHMEMILIAIVTDAPFDSQRASVSFWRRFAG